MLNNIGFQNSSSISFIKNNIENEHHYVSKRDHDFDSLTKFLKENGVTDNDIKTLEDLIEVEGEVNLETGYGKKVKEWITHLISKST